MWSSQATSNEFVTQSPNDTQQSVRAHRQVRSMGEVAFLYRFKEQIKTVASWCARL